MTIQTELRTATDRVIAARRELAGAERARIAAKRNADVAADDLDTARRALMARSDAGTNDAARRAYAERETRNERNHADMAADALVLAEVDAIAATADLRIAEDERRYLELVAQLTIAGAADIATANDLARATYVAEAMAYANAA